MALFRVHDEEPEVVDRFRGALPIQPDRHRQRVSSRNLFLFGRSEVSLAKVVHFIGESGESEA